MEDIYKIVIVCSVIVGLYYLYEKYNNNKILFYGIDKLKEGNKEFVNNFGIKNNKGYIETQKPHTTILCCSDSRVPVERIFNLPKGEIFVVREAGHVPCDISIASIEYSIAVLGVQNLVVLGHTECGAVKATMSNKDLGSPALNKLAESIRNDLREGDNLDDAILHHSQSVLNNVINNSQIIKDAVQSGNVKIAYAIYDIQTGIVQFYEK